jgi:trk system potassium uptake protein
MRITIAGAGRAGLAVAAFLRDAGHEVSVIDREPATATRAFEEHGLVAFTGDATDAALLTQAQIGRADVVVAMLRRDAENLAVALLARAAGAGRVMVRMRDPEYRAVYHIAKVDRILSEIDVFVGALATAIEHDGVRHAMVLGSGASVAFELTIPDDGFVVGRTVQEVASDAAFPQSCVFAGMFQSGEVLAPRGSSVVAAGMHVLLVAPRDQVGDVVSFFQRK